MEPVPVVRPPGKKSRRAHYLRDFLRLVFEPTRLRGCSPRYRAFFQEALQKFAEVLRREPLLADLNPTCMELLVLRLTVEGLSPDRIQTIKKALRTLWRFAADMGISPPVSPRRSALPPPPRIVHAAVPPLEATVAAFFESTYLPEALAHAGEKHRGKMKFLIALLKRCFGRDILLQELSGSIVAAFVSWRSNEAGPGTVMRERGCILSIWRYAHDLGQAPPPCRVPKIRVPREQPDAWSLDEVRRIIDAASRLKAGPMCGVPAPKYWKAILLVCWYTGLRRGALLKIKPSYLELDQRWLYVPAGCMKNFVGKRYRLGQDAVDALREIYDPTRSEVFGEPATNCRLNEQFQMILELAKVPPSRHFLNHFHKLRRTVATHTAVKMGLAAASALLGHGTGDLLKHYIDPTFTVGNDSTEWLPPLSSSN